MTLSIEAIANRDRYYQETAKANGQNYYPGAAFTVSPANVQKFIQDIQKDLAIMKKIKYRSVPQRSSQTLSFGVTRGIHSRGNTTNHNAADNKQVNTYTTAERKYRMLIPFADIDTWQGYVRFVDEMKRLYKENYVHELLYIGMMGIDRHADPESFYDSGNPWDYLQHVDRGWRVVLESLNASNVITGWEVGTNVIIYGKDREIPLESVVATSEAAGAKTGIPLAGHGFITGGQIFVLGETGYDTVYIVQPETTADKVVIDKAYAATTFSATASLKQKKDFSNVGSLVGKLKRKIPRVKRNGLECWLADDLAEANEFKILDSQNPATPSEQGFISKMTASLGLMPTYEPAIMPASTIWVLNPSTLGIYELNGSRRREAKDDLDLSAQTDKTYYEADNVVEDPDRFVVAENVHELEAYTP